MKKDKYLRARGGRAEKISILCVKCGAVIIEYQKDGIGYLHRCYLNRIISPEKYSKLQFDQTITKPSEVLKLKCNCCELIGTPMKYSDGRLAYRLERGKYIRKKSKQD